MIAVETDSAEKIQALAVARGVELTPLPARDVERAAQLSAGSSVSVYRGGLRMPFRVGSGHDVHGLVEGRPLVLGGVLVPSSVGFDTHSDGYVLSHALVDALAGAIADGDLGTHFPEDDPDAQDARSLDFVKYLVGLVRADGYEIANVDMFVVLGTTRLRPHLDGMRRNLAEALDVDVKQVSVKARSNDGLGDAGTGRACEAWATVLIYPASD